MLRTQNIPSLNGNNPGSTSFLIEILHVVCMQHNPGQHTHTTSIGCQFMQKYGRELKFKIFNAVDFAQCHYYCV